LGQPSADRDYQPGHARMLQLLAGMEPFRPLLRIRIAGTNGKGSTAFMLAAALQANGLKVGLYTSPHILSFNERIRINGEPVANTALLASLAHLMPIATAAGASYFETATALALDQFRQAEVDVEILEAGVGARLDATTAIGADLAVITPIGLDHQDWLGDDIATIADEKSYVMKDCSMVISAPQHPAVAAVLRAFHPDDINLTDINITDNNLKLHFCDIDPSSWPPLATPGQHQQGNASLAFAACQQLQSALPSFDLDAARHAITRCNIPGRLQYIHIGQAQIWLDAAHNSHAIEALLPSLAALADPFDAILVFTRQDRSLADALPLLEPFTRQLISNDASPHQTTLLATDALQQAIQQQPTGRFLVLGSFTTVAAILQSVEASRKK